jgi:hypothetical protein
MAAKPQLRRVMPNMFAPGTLTCAFIEPEMSKQKIVEVSSFET